MTTSALPEPEDRTRFIGGSDVAAILGHSPYKTPLKVWEEKCGLSRPFEGNSHTQRGIELEDIAARKFSEKYTVKVQRMNTRITHPLYPFLTARIDRRVLGRPRRALLEVKCPSLGAYSKMKRTGLGADYVAQMQHYLGLTGYDEGFWGIFCADQWEMIDWPVEANLPLIGDMTDRLVAFWHDHILTRIPPPAVEADEERLEIRRIEGGVALHDVSADLTFIEAAAILRDARIVAKESELVKEEAELRIKELMGDRLGVFEGGTFRISYTEQGGKKSFDQKALAGAKPLDRLAVGALLTPLFEKAEPGSEVEQIVAAIGKCDLDLTRFNKVGNAFKVLRPTFYEAK